MRTRTAFGLALALALVGSFSVVMTRKHADPAASTKASTPSTVAIAAVAQPAPAAPQANVPETPAAVAATDNQAAPEPTKAEAPVRRTKKKTARMQLAPVAEAPEAVTAPAEPAPVAATTGGLDEMPAEAPKKKRFVALTSDPDLNPYGSPQPSAPRNTDAENPAN
jgi:hypothetical protein